MSKVAIVKCESYDYAKVKQSVQRGIELLGGLSSLVNPNDKILLKPNLLSADSPERASTTHFNVFKAVAEAFKEICEDVSFGDSPGIQKAKTVAQKNGILEVANGLSIPLADFINGEDVTFQDGRQNKKFTIAKGVLDSDAIISISKMKAHGLTRITGAIKNQFGCIPGALKGEFHVKIPTLDEFSKMLVDLNMFLKPRLYIMDGIVAMEGNGPRSGNPRKMNVLLFSTDPVALDSTFCRLVNLNPETVPPIVFGHEFGLGTHKESEIELLGDNITPLIQSDFDVNRDTLKTRRGGKLVNLLQKTAVQWPYIVDNKCIKCGVCVKVCPAKPKALDWKDETHLTPPIYDYSKCIRCYCCQELCPEGAIYLKVPLIRRIFSKGLRRN